MSDFNDGGPAFPLQGTATDEDRAYRFHGMTLRDWFAGQALGSIPLRQWNAPGVDDADIIELWARCAYAVADAMLAARDKR